MYPTKQPVEENNSAASTQQTTTSPTASSVASNHAAEISRKDRLSINKQLVAWRKGGPLPSFTEYDDKTRAYALDKLHSQQGIEGDKPLKKRLHIKIKNYLHRGAKGKLPLTDLTLNAPMQTWLEQEFKNQTKYFDPETQNELLDVSVATSVGILHIQ
ncbi:hypothetical protein [Piscirickettsia salmonis]|uniref:hypothetical protein n=1 Tax=Piscirickettsia salmonis TaxID=1238 RepID=UPI0007C8C8A8|nr:hypothetical protein A0O36_02296 [Piscirickettsiaceae bacterium NZ-RLO1]